MEKAYLPGERPVPSSLLEPFISSCRDLGSRHVALFGSALRKPLQAVTDVDVHVVMARMDSLAYSRLRSAAEETAPVLAAHVERPWRVELRHGPFKPPPGRPRILQFHLLIDDETSLQLLPAVIRAQRAAAGHCVSGVPLLELAPAWVSSIQQRREAQVELRRWYEALAASTVVFRHWVFTPMPRLVEDSIPATTAWERHCLLRAAAAAADLHFFNMILAEAPALAPPADTMRPMLGQVDGEAWPWQSLVARWEEARDWAMGAIERRLALV
jgi:predicted nucleotidyltransferase